MKPFVLINDDYSCAQYGEYSFYYGYESAKVDDGPWYFQAKKNGLVFYEATAKELKQESFDCVGCLLAGMAVAFAQGGSK